MSSTPFLSVCIPTYNRVNYLEKCIRSVLPQITDEIEVVIQDNASTDDTWTFLSSLSHPQIRCIRNDSNIGLVPNFIEVVKKSRGSYVYVLTDDDYLLTDGLNASIRFARRSQCLAFKTAFFQFNEVSKTGGHSSLFNKDVFGKEMTLVNAAKVYHESNIFTGFVFSKSLFNEHVLLEHKNNWYPSLLIAGLAGLNIGYLPEPTNVHIWENETYWGISPEKRSELNRGQVAILLYLVENRHISIDHYKELVKQHLSKWFYEDNTLLLRPFFDEQKQEINVHVKKLGRKILMQRIKAWIKSRLF